MQSKRLEYVADPNKFDLMVDRWDGQGKKTAHNPYRLHIVNGTSYYERPVNSGNLFFDNNQPAGRVEYTFGETGKISKKEFKVGDKAVEHVQWSAPLTGDAKLHFELEQEKARNAQLAAELASIKKEQEPKVKSEETKTEVKAAPTTLKRG